MVTLQITDAFCAYQRCVLGVLDTFGHRREAKALDEIEQIMEEDPFLLALREIPDERAINLDSVDRQDLKMSQRGVAGTEIVESDAAARVMQRVHEACRLFDVVECCGFSDFHNQATGEVGLTAHQQNQRVEPPPVTGRQAGYVDTEPYLGMVGELPHRLLENKTVDKSDQTHLLDRRNEFAASDDASFQVTHPQQALEIIYFSCRRAHHRLESKEQPILAQCRLNCRAYRQAVRSAVKLNLVLALAHRSIAPSSLSLPRVRSPPGGSLMLTGAQRSDRYRYQSGGNLNHTAVKQSSNRCQKAILVSPNMPISHGTSCRRGAGHGLSGILGTTGAERCGTGHDEAIYDATNQHNARGNRQVCIEIAESDRFPSDEGAE